MTLITNANVTAASSPKSPLYQIKCMIYELKLIVNKKKWRWITCWFGGSAGVIVSYRLDRLGFLVFKNAWPALRILFFPLFVILRILSFSHEIHYGANIGMGLKILHPSLGVVVSGKLIAGEHLLLTGGNCLGVRSPFKYGEFIIGNDVTLGANAVILGPLTLGNEVRIGAGAVVIESAPSHVTLTGVPAKIYLDSK
jgi:serine acetyltransferase